MYEMGQKPDDTDAEQVDPDDDMHETGKQKDEQSGDDGDAGGQVCEV
jgi:hypothetical protein